MMTRRPGFALLVSVFMIMALAVLALGVLAVGAREVRIADAAERLLQARSVAEAMARAELSRWSTRRWGELQTGQVRQGLVTGDDHESRVQRLDSVLFLIRTEARVPDASGNGLAGQAGLLVRTLPVSTLAPVFPAALASTGGVLVSGGEISGGAVEPGAWASGSPVPGRAPGILAPEVIRWEDVALTGEPPVLRSEPAALEPDLFELVAQPEFGSLAPPVRALAPRPLSTGGECVPDPWNWGARSPADPCHGFWPVIHADADLEITGGEARAVLVVEGDLAIRGGAQLEGLVLVRGALILEEGGSIRGAVRVGAAEVRGGTIVWDAATVHEALAAPAFDRGFRPPERWWVPVF